ncbi:MAG: hypothetical protein WA716_24870 [Pseudolabrys sp.]
MTKSKITAVALTALTLAGSLAATSGSAQAHSHRGHRRRHRYCRRRADRGRGRFQRLRHPVYVTGPSCRLVTRYDRFGNARMIQVCNYY